MICESLGLFEVVKDKHTLCSQANLGESCESDPVNSDAAVGGGGGCRRGAWKVFLMTGCPY